MILHSNSRANSFLNYEVLISQYLIQGRTVKLEWIFDLYNKGTRYGSPFFDLCHT
jgi:hypothetical protein